MNKQRQPVLFVYCLALGLMLLSSAAHAGGIALYEVGPTQTGLASAGYASRAEDASTLFTNPAGMTRLKKSELLTGIQPLYTNIKFSPDARTTTTGSEGNAQGWLPTGEMYYVHSISPDLKVGIGMVGYFGLALDYGDEWVGRYYVKNDALQGITFQPSAAYKVTDKLSLGAGLNAMYASLEQKMAVNNVLDGLPDGELKVDDTTWGFGANVGVLYEFDPKTRIGINYLSEVKLDFTVRPEFRGIGPTLLTLLTSRGLTTSSIDMGMKVPQMVMLSFYRQLNDRWALMADVGWQQWSAFGKVDVDLSSSNPKSLTADLKYEDTWHYALGAQCRLSQPWLLFFGAAYDTSAVKSADLTVTVPMGESYRFGTGTQYQWNDHLSLSFAYELVCMGTLNVDQERGPLAGRVAGEYRNASIHAIQAAMRYQF
jgi:long-chain fatty acid transport protein